MNLTRPHLSAFFMALLVVFSSPALTLAQEPAPDRAPTTQALARPTGYVPESVPLTQTYSPVALGTIGVLFPTSAVITVFGGKLFAAPVPAMGAPTPGSLDYRVASNFHGDLESGAPFLGGIPDYGGYALSALPVLYYGLGATWTGLTGQNLYPWQGPSHLHSTMAYLESFTWTALLTNAAKFFVGRARPYVALERRAYGWHGGEDYLSFFSGHASLSFAAATFLARDISDGLYHRVLADAEPTERFLLGRALPYTLLYGAATTVAVSRLYDQKHFLSDVVVGAAVGTLISALVYNTRFDGRGIPRTRRGLALDVAPSPSPEPAEEQAQSAVDDRAGVAADQRLDLAIP
ncbi:phosphatase PAP2 family protein [Lujinxingia vulgaris]|uniref:Phosphatase PAP2 family protein n=1 Tax=Lujinxingia vulgaris TaxID=2600176 RepID=A0A5C6XI67_9DELT|nr:phosphatase PAP2 family protein [Lujinxingia vulgaris]TXD38565.1 phosphatase PAP2 family protein [Lujinxingia vulgaris]